MRGRTLALLLPIALAAPVLLAQTRSLVVPDFPDLTVKKRQSLGTSKSTTEVLYLKGARERREFLFEEPGRTGLAGHATITQCDRRRSVQLNPEARLYSVFVLKEWSMPLKGGPPVPEAQGADVTTTFDAVDTGGRRQVGRYVARRVRTTVTVDPSPGANTPASTRETDGWYIDLPGLGCSDADGTAYLTTSVAPAPGGLRDRHHYKTEGTARRGYAIEETNRSTGEGWTHTDRVELIELSERPLDSTLFEIPTDYRPALPLVRGGYDMTKPDTLANRLQVYWEEVTLIARSILR